MARRRIAVLGGGIGSLSAVHELVKSGQDFDITVYQMGWRLGGKGATGRNLDARLGHRIEEHGLHMWSGLYDNAFRVMRECYAALARPAGSKLATVEDAFTPHSSIVLYEEWKGTWLTWNIVAPTNDERPGEPGAEVALRLWDYVGIALQFLFRTPGSSGGFWEQGAHVALTVVLTPLSWLARVVFSLLAFLHLEEFLARILLVPVTAFLSLFWRYARPRLDDTEVRRAWMTANFAYANLRGSVRANVFARGLDPLDSENYRDWITKHMHDDRVGGKSVTASSPLVSFLYDAQFSYAGGDLSKPDMGAGSALKTLLRMAFTWKGAILWRMEAGMGEAVFVPLYETLKAKGVKFEFFHQVKSMAFSEDGGEAVSVSGLRQAKPKGGAYDPLFLVKALPCWPSEPFWDRLEGGESLRGNDFESYACDVGEPFELRAGRDFDEIVFGFPVGCVPFIAPELARKHAHWKTMLDAQKTVRTQALQIWTSRPKGDLGTAGVGEALAVTYHPTPLNTMADMTFLIEKEAWERADSDSYPQSLFYFCGPLKGDDVWANSLELMGSLVFPLMPRATVPPGTPGAPFRWEWLVDDAHPAAAGCERLRAQYLRANTSPSELFTLTNVGATSHRIHPSRTGVRNFKVTGDWTDNTFNLANIEATTMSGMLCSQALCGFPSDDQIVGLGFGCGPDWKASRPTSLAVSSNASR